MLKTCVSFHKILTYETLVPFQLKHDLTMVVAGPFKLGKTKIIKN